MDDPKPSLIVPQPAEDDNMNSPPMAASVSMTSPPIKSRTPSSGMGSAGLLRSISRFEMINSPVPKPQRTPTTQPEQHAVPLDPIITKYMASYTAVTQHALDTQAALASENPVHSLPQILTSMTNHINNGREVFEFIKNKYSVPSQTPP
jgi:hypothetical protein